ncbi:MAG: glycosyltransferase, partial [Candidatus Binatia bacterium]
MPENPVSTAGARRLSFVVPVRNDAEGLRRCLASLSKSDFPRERMETIVADNGSVDDSQGVAREMGAIVLELPGKRVAGLRNEGATRATGEILAFVDADQEIDPMWARCALEALEEPGVAAAGAPYSPPPAPTWVQRIY